MRLKLTIAYDGAAFKGWQSQPFGNTVQDVLEDALKRIAGSRVIVHASGRTDTGVHALAQIAHVDLPERFAPAEWQRIVNHNLPAAIRIMQCRRVPPDFSAKKTKGKIYRYQIRQGDVTAPHEAGRVWLVPETLDMARLHAAAKLFVGRHDFAGFGSNRKNPTQTIRTITRLAVAKRGSLITLTFEGDGFLYRMVRLITCAIVRVARGDDDLATIAERLHAPGKPVWTQAAPAAGLYLVKVLY